MKLLILTVAILFSASSALAGRGSVQSDCNATTAQISEAFGAITKWKMADGSASIRANFSNPSSSRLELKMGKSTPAFRIGKPYFSQCKGKLKIPASYVNEKKENKQVTLTVSVEGGQLVVWGNDGGALSKKFTFIRDDGGAEIPKIQDLEKLDPDTSLIAV